MFRWGVLSTAKIGREYGISAFCFYFYWFGGKTLLETPLRNWLNDKTIDLKFCLCWANEKWTRTWDGRGDEILIDQKHSPEDDIAFIEHVAEYMRDPRYLRVDGKPLLLVYRPGMLPDAVATAQRWRTWWSEQYGGEIHVSYVQSFDTSPPATFGFDSAVSFPPNRGERSRAEEDLTLINPHYSGAVLDWRTMAVSFMQRPQPPFPHHAGVNCGWDNESRRPGKAQTFIHASPRGYRDWLEHEIRSRQATESKSVVFINAWNEWAEGAVLEPSVRNGFAYLNATRSALLRSGNVSMGAPVAPAPYAIVHVWYPEILTDLLARLIGTGLEWNLLVTTSTDKHVEVARILDTSCFAYRILVVENRGRDVMPFIIAANQLLDEGIDVVLKVHTKRSPHRRDGDAWRADLLDKLIDNGNAASIFSSFNNDRHLGLVAPAGHTQPMNYYWGDNRLRVQSLLKRIGLKAPDTNMETFVSGSMFWVRLESLRALLDADLVPSDFEDEVGQVDGTLAHAIERVFALCARAHGFRTTDTESAGNFTQAPYSYAKRS